MMFQPRDQLRVLLVAVVMAPQNLVNPDESKFRLQRPMSQMNRANEVRRIPIRSVCVANAVSVPSTGTFGLLKVRANVDSEYHGIEVHVEQPKAPLFSTGGKFDILFSNKSVRRGSEINLEEGSESTPRTMLDRSLERTTAFIPSGMKLACCRTRSTKSVEQVICSLRR